MAEIRLRGKYAVGKYSHAIVDDELFGYLDQWAWHLKPNSTGSSYYVVRTHRENGRYRRIRMHRVVYAQGTTGAHDLEWDGKHDIDHINRDPFDNRFDNLRLATKSENSLNRSSSNYVDLRCKYCGSSFRRATNQPSTEGCWCGACEKAPTLPVSPVAFLPCQQCGTVFVSKGAGLNTKRYCSPDCKQKGKDRRRRRSVRREPKQCGWCDSTFVPPRSDSTFCSRTCSDRWRWSDEGTAKAAWLQRKADSEHEN